MPVAKGHVHTVLSLPQDTSDALKQLAKEDADADGATRPDLSRTVRLLIRAEVQRRAEQRAAKPDTKKSRPKSR